MRHFARFPSLRRRGSVLLIVLVTLVFATSALLLFIEKAGTDLLVDIREADAARLRQEAYSSLETTLAVLEDFRVVGDGLHGPAEGWGDPLGFAGYTPAEGHTVKVSVEDESAKLPLPSVKAEMLIALFKFWQVPQTDAERLTDSLLGWIKRDHTVTTIGAPTLLDYENTALPFAPPGQSLRSFAELAAIEGVRQLFFDEVTGLPTALYQRFTDTFSLYDFDLPNLNGNRLEPLLAQETIDTQQQQRVAEFLSGAGPYQSQGPGFFKSGRSVAAVAGGQLEKLGYGYKVSALRITVTVRQGQASFRLIAVVAPEGGAKVVTASSASSAATEASPAAASSPKVAQKSDSKRAPTADKTSGQPADLKYPFTFLDFRENDSSVPLPATTAEPTA